MNHANDSQMFLDFRDLDDPGYLGLRSTSIYCISLSGGLSPSSRRSSSIRALLPEACKQDHNHPGASSHPICRCHPCPALAKSERTSESSIWGLLFASTKISWKATDGTLWHNMMHNQRIDSGWFRVCCLKLPCQGLLRKCHICFEVFQFLTSSTLHAPTERKVSHNKTCDLMSASSSWNRAANIHRDHTN